MNQSSDTEPGTLYVVATPIGNLKDITLRAIEVLQNCAVVACEDTRHSMRLFQAHDIDTKTIALHQHNENQHSKKIIARLLKGDDVALVSDAGTPLISDPGFPLLQLAHEHSIKVVPIPGPSALITLLSVASINTQPFMFHGFLPAKSLQRITTYESWKDINATHVFYESSHRIVKSINDLLTVFGPDTMTAMGRELTKTFEHVFKGPASDLFDLIQSNSNHQKGEFVIAVLNQSDQNEQTINGPAAGLVQQLKPLLPPKIVAKIVSNQYKLNKKKVYQFILDQE